MEQVPALLKPLQSSPQNEKVYITKLDLSCLDVNEEQAEHVQIRANALFLENKECSDRELDEKDKAFK